MKNLLFLFLAFTVSLSGQTIPATPGVFSLSGTGGGGGGGDATLAGNNTWTGTNGFSGQLYRNAATASSSTLDVTKAALNRALAASETESFSATPTTDLQLPVFYTTTGGPWIVNWTVQVYSYYRQTDIQSAGITVPADGTYMVVYNYSLARARWEISGDPVLVTGTGPFVLQTNGVLVTPNIGAATATSLIVSNNANPLPTPPTGSQIQVGTYDILSGSTPAYTAVTLDAFKASSTGPVGTQFIGRVSYGPNSAKTAVASGVTMAALQGYAYGASAYNATANTEIRFVTTQTQTNTAHGSQITFYTTPNASATAALALTLDQDKSAIFAGTILPLSASGPTTATAGAFAFDNDAWAASRGAMQVFDGTANTWVVATLASDTPTNGQVPTWNTGGTITWETPTSGGTPGGATTQIQFNNAGSFGGVAGLIVDTTTGAITQTQATALPGLTLINSTLATVGVQQASPYLVLSGNGWKTTATAASQQVDWRFLNQPVQGTGNPTTSLQIGSQVNGGGFVNQLTISSAGAIAGSAGATFNGSLSTAGSGSSTITSGSTGGFTIGSNSKITSSSNGVMLLSNNAGSAGADVTMGNIISSTAGKGLQLQSGTGQRAGNATLVAGTVTVTNTTATANTVIVLTRKTSGGTIGDLSYSVSAGVSFTINSVNALDTSNVSYLMIEVN